ncbi:molecular chaperone (ABC1), putative [Paecilomyces variotii No. 5]|uniref:Molecular chaperone (ABC1), putative n=1 Tax=Byssochlamys spectabilis (strain No. 5 / NBRC 109023) TaxID=1356009 RepID=V5FS72_BYSSN|nr:molecular chaperone (ABC1), putative [Paecilomyces variotii No. 5]
MSGKRLLDAIQFFNVAKSVAGKHLALRQRQLDVYTRTSSLTKGIQSQTEGIILTAKAAAALAQRFNEPSPVTKPPPSERREPTSTSESQQADLRVKQSQAARDPLPDGTIPPDTISVSARPLPSEDAKKAQRQAEFQIPQKAAGHPAEEQGDRGVGQDQEVFNKPSTTAAPVLSSLPRVKVPKATGDVQEGNGKINADVFYSSAKENAGKTVPKEDSSAEEDKLSDEMMSEIFHSPRVAKILSRKGALDLRNNSREARVPGTITAEKIAFSGEQLRPNESRTDKESMEELGSSLAQEAATSDPVVAAASPAVKPIDAYQMVESRVPSSRLGRLWQYGGLATSMAFGAVGEGFRRVTGSGETNGSLMFSAGNMERLVSKLSKMRGAALKLGQMMSFQDSKMLPEPIQQVLQRVQDRADYMPASQRDKVLTDNLGPNWRDLFESFEEKPMAAASIGQVHGAVLKNGKRVAVKIQYPGVADSIDSDLNNLSILLTASRLLPKGLYLDKTIANARTELAWECDYIREAEAGNRFREFLRDESSTFVVPEIIPEASGKQVLTMERMNGIAVTKIQNFTQEQRDWIGTQILRLSLREITEFRYMQTDPNWTNFLYNAETNRLELLDFGASREYPADFINTYLRTLIAASRNDKDACRDLSIKLGYLTGYESPAMVDAHITSILTLAEPFMASSPEVYDFNNQTITERVRALIPVMIRERLTPPPEETYSLHRKLSGAFLLCARLGSRVRTREMFTNAIQKAEGLDLS